MQHWKLSGRSVARLAGVHPALVSVLRRGLELSVVDFGVSEGVRTIERQRELFAAGASKTMNSRHLVAPNGYSHAADVFAVVGGRVRWDWPLYERIAAAVKEASEELGVPIEWGGDWVTFRDGPHFQLPWKEYPGTV